MLHVTCTIVQLCAIISMHLLQFGFFLLFILLALLGISFQLFCSKLETPVHYSQREMYTHSHACPDIDSLTFKLKRCSVRDSS